MMGPYGPISGDPGCREKLGVRLETARTQTDTGGQVEYQSDPGQILVKELGHHSVPSGLRGDPDGEPPRAELLGWHRPGVATVYQKHR